MTRYRLLLLLLVANVFPANAESGYDLWLRYQKIDNATLLDNYRKQITGFYIPGTSPTIDIIKREIQRGLNGLLDKSIPAESVVRNGAIIIATIDNPALAAIRETIKREFSQITSEGYLIRTITLTGKKVILITASTDVGLLYGAFAFLRTLQTHQPIDTINAVSNPKIQRRILNHWDNLDRTVERGYAGFSLWDWHKLPDYIDPRYHDYARANASIGINGTVLTNVNANALVLTPMYLDKVKALADVFRPYGIKVYLTARFSAPMEIGGLKTADPLDTDVQQWWKEKVKEIYRYVPDFGGFVVKANSEGQPGPQNYGRSHADGANVLAEALMPFNGIVMWRAFVYDNAVPVDRTKQAYNEFKPLDGKFLDNVIIQVKNGPLDFQPREPFHPLFGAMIKTPLMPEFQITQEYLGFSTHLVYLSTLFKECLDADTYAYGAGSTVAKIVDGSLTKQPVTAIAGVANIGTDQNWCGHQFAQANWYAFARLAWDHPLTSEQIADEWIRMTWSNDVKVIAAVKEMMMRSREDLVNYMTPLGLHHIMGWSHHYGPGPWIKDKHRADWTSVYYHRADSLGVGFDRSSTGSNALEQYYPPVRQQFETLEKCPEQYLLWFHHVSWDTKLKSGKTLWEELCAHYDMGVDGVARLQRTWNTLESSVDHDRFRQVQDFLAIQYKEAKWWRDACTSYFQSRSHRPFPIGFTPPEKPLSYYIGLNFPYAPGIRPQW